MIIPEVHSWLRKIRQFLVFICMTHTDLSPIRNTSVTLRTSTRAALRTAVKATELRGLHFSEQRLMRECLRIALKFWRSRGSIAACNRRYNKRVGEYQIVPFYSSESLRSVSWARCHHSGMSLSRLMDFAVTHYLPRVVEYWLRFEHRGTAKSDAVIWREKYAKRLHSEDFIISYQSKTQSNDGTTLEYREKTEILPWPPPNQPILF
jgi:hypothetical protein